MGTPNLNFAPLGQIQVGALAAGNLSLVVPALLGGAPLGYQPLAGLNPDGTYQPIQPSFLFQFEGENKTILESDITDHYIESNSAIEDGIALHPQIVVVHGFVGELTDTAPGFSGTLNNVQQAAKTVTDKLQGVSAYAPVISTAATSIYNQASQAYATANSVYNSGSSVVDSLTGQNPTQGKQAQAYLWFKQMRLARQLFNVQTPWEVCKNFAIQSVVVTQVDSTNMVTDFMVTFKAMNFTQVSAGNFLANVPSVPSTTLVQPALGSSLFNSSSSQLSVSAPTAGTAPSVLPGTLSGSTFNLGAS